MSMSDNLSHSAVVADKAPAADRLLEDIGREAAREVLQAARLRASERWWDVDVEAGDVLRAYGDIQASRSTIGSMQSRYRAGLASALALAALSAAALAVSVGQAEAFPFGSVIVALGAAAVALIASVLTALLLERRSPNEAHSASRTSAEYEVVAAWAALERALRARVGRESAHLPLASLIEDLRSDPKVHEGDVEQLRFVLKMRNEVVHDRLDPSESDAQRVLMLASRLLSSSAFAHDSARPVAGP